MSNLLTLVLENTIYANDQEKEDLIKNDIQLVKDIFWINTLGFFCLQKDFPNGSRTQKYFKKLDKAQIKSIGQDVNDMAAATKLAHDAGLLNTTFTTEFTKLLFLLKQKPNMTIDEKKLRELFNRIIFSKIMPSPKIRAITQKYLAGDAELDHVVFPYYYYARQKKFSNDFQFFCKIFYKSMSAQAAELRKKEKAGQDISSHMDGPSTSSKTIVATQTKAPAGIVAPAVVSPAVAMPVAPPAPKKDDWYNWEKIDFFKRARSTHPEYDDMIHLFLGSHATSKWQAYFINTSVSGNLEKKEFLADFLDRWKSISDLADLKPLSPNSEILKLNPYLVDIREDIKKRPIHYIKQIYRFSDSISNSLYNWGFFKDGKIDPLVDQFQSTNAGNIQTTSMSVYETQVGAKAERTNVMMYLDVTSYNFPSYASYPDVVALLNKYPKKNFNVEQQMLSALNGIVISNSWTATKDSKVINLAYYSPNADLKSKAKALILDIVGEGLQAKYTEITPEAYLEAEKNLASIDIGALIADKIINGTLSSFNKNQRLYIASNSLEKYLKTDSDKMKFLKYIVGGKFSELVSSNEKWLEPWLKSQPLDKNSILELVRGSSMDAYGSMPTFVSDIFVERVVTPGFLKSISKVLPKSVLERKKLYIFAGSSDPTSYYHPIAKLDGIIKQAAYTKLTENPSLGDWNFTELRTKYPGDIKNGDLGRTSQYSNTTYLDGMQAQAMYKAIDADPYRNVGEDYKAFIQIFSASESYSTPTVSAFRNNITKYTENEIMKYLADDSQNDKYGNTYSNNMSYTSASLLGKRGTESAPFRDYVISKANSLAEDFENLDFDSKTMKAIADNIVTSSYLQKNLDVQKFVNGLNKKLTPEQKTEVLSKVGKTLYNHTSFNNLYFKLRALNEIDSVMSMKTIATNDIGQIIRNAKDDSGSIDIRNVEEIISIFATRNVEGPGGIGDVYYRIEPMMEEFSIREIVDQIMDETSFSQTRKEQLLDRLFNSINIGRKGNDRRNGVVSKVVGDATVREALMKNNENSAIKITTSLKGANLAEIFKFNNFEVALPKELKPSNKKTIYQNIIDAKSWQPDIPDLKVLKYNDTDVDLDRKTAEYSKYYNNKHGDYGLKFLESFEVNLEIFPEHSEFLKTNPTPTIIPAFHGTGSVAAAMILRFGFKIVTKAVAGVNIAGKMLGDGVYFSNILSKSMQYIGDSGFGRSVGTVGYIFEMDAYVGETPTHHRSAGVGGDNIRSPEWCVFDPRAQLVIKKAHKVQIVNGNEVRELKNKYPEVLKEDVYFKGFKQFISEARVMKPNEITFIFKDGMIPDKDGKLLEHDVWLKKYPRAIFAPGQYGPEITVTGNREDVAPYVHIPNSVEFVRDNPEGYYEVWKKLFPKR